MSAGDGGEGEALSAGEDPSSLKTDWVGGLCDRTRKPEKTLERNPFGEVCS